MTVRPHDITDLYLAPVALALQARINELGRLSAAELSDTIALESDCPDWTRGLREDALVRTVEHLVDTHGWTVSWDPAGIRMANGPHSIVLGVPQSLHAYLDAAHAEPAATR